MLKQQIHNLVNEALKPLQSQGLIDTLPEFKIDTPRQPEHGDFACNVAMILAKQAKQNPRELAQRIVEHLPYTEDIYKTEIAGPGFINFFVADKAYHHIIQEILHQGERFGMTEEPSGLKAHLEFVSANPTGPLHVGHGRNAAYGATLGNILEAAGHEVHREYYVNDAGRQIANLTLSVWLRYLALYDSSAPFPQAGYHGDYIADIARSLQEQYSDKFYITLEELNEQTRPSDPSDAESYIDALTQAMRAMLAPESYRELADFVVDAILETIQHDLQVMGVHYDRWFRESELVEQGAVAHGIDMLRQHNCLYEKHGATWFRSTHYGDSKDRVLIRDNGQPTYFASDVAYHLDKLERGYNQLIDVLGADHHGYVPRIQAFLQALDNQDQYLNAILVQFAVLYRGSEKISMSTRGGQFVTLRQLCDEVGADAARYFYIMRKPDQHLDFDLELAKSRTTDNPVYYIQYAHARICSVWRQLHEKSYEADLEEGQLYFHRLDTQHEQALMRWLARFPEVIQSAAAHFEPHELTNYMEKAAMLFHTYYNAYPFIVDDDDLRNARFCLIDATRHILYNGLNLIGVSAPEAM